MATVCNDGLEWQAKYLNHYDTGGPWTVIALASSSQAEATVAAIADFITNDTYFTEVTDGGLARAVATTCGYEASYKSTWVKVFTATASRTVRSLAIANSATRAGSHGLLYHLFSADKNLVDTDTLTITVKLTQSV
jgi:hypothetical protein